MNAKESLESVGREVSRDFVQNRTLLSYEEYIELFLQRPRSQARNAAQYLRDTLDFFGSVSVPHPTGTIRRFRIFDLTEGERQGRVAGQEEVQNAIYRLVGNFARTGRVNKLILLARAQWLGQVQPGGGAQAGSRALLARAGRGPLPAGVGVSQREAGEGQHRLRGADGGQQQPRLLGPPGV